MKITTGTWTLGIIASIFAIDTVLSTGSHATISEWFYIWLHTGWEAPAIFFAGVFGLFFHFWWFRPIEDKNSSEKEDQKDNI